MIPVIKPGYTFLQPISYFWVDLFTFHQIPEVLLPKQLNLDQRIDLILVEIKTYENLVDIAFQAEVINKTQYKFLQRIIKKLYLQYDLASY